MDITKFYELRTRLYNTAAAGCMTISEDFRLKRAVEEFKPLSSANKAFEMLYKLCEKLLSAEKPEGVLPDCIALVDALAVTQGIFADGADNEKTTPASGTLTSANKAADLKTIISKSTQALWKLSADYRDLLRDPRTVVVYLRELENGKFNDNFKIFSEIICEVCGKALVPGLKASVKTSGRQIQYIAKLAGAEENEYFRALAADRKTPEKVRVAAVSALSCSLENGELLAELFNTGNAKVRPAALLAMAEMDAPEAEPIFEKLLVDYQKNRKFLTRVVGASTGKTCTEFAGKYLLQLKEDFEHSKDKDKRFNAMLELEGGAAWMLENKAGLDDIFLELEVDRRYEKKSASKCECNEVLMKGLSGKNKDAVRAQVERLYAKEPRTFRKAKMFSDLLADPDKDPEFTDNDEYDLETLLHAAYYVPLLDGYYIYHFYTYDNDLFPILRLCKRFPEWIFSNLRDTADETENRFKSVQAPTRAEMLEKAKALGFKEMGRYDALSAASQRTDFMVNQLAESLHSELLKNCAPEDREPLRQAALYMARKCVPYVGGCPFTDIIKSRLPEITPQEHAKLLADYTINRMVLENYGEMNPVMHTLSGRLTNDEMVAALMELRERVLEWRGRMDNKAVRNELNAIDNFLKEMQSGN